MSHVNTVWDDIEKIRKQNPLVLNLTNYVAMDFTANALLALGASPIMAHAEEELPELVAQAGALVINIGTLDACWLKSMERALKLARELKKPAVLDPVGAGATEYRTHAAVRLLEMGGMTIVRGNASEILALLGRGARSRGVDSLASTDEVRNIFREHSAQLVAPFVASGASDYIFAENQEAVVENGHPGMSRITAMGCVATSVIAAFLCVNPSVFQAGWEAMATMGICGELAGQSAKGPGSFRAAFLDALSELTFDQLRERLRVSIQ